MKLLGILPPLSVLKLFLPITHSDGRLPALYPSPKSLRMLSEYGRNTCRLSAYGRSDFESHQTTFTASVTRILSILTHCIGPGSRARFSQKKSCARTKGCSRS